MSFEFRVSKCKNDTEQQGQVLLTYASRNSSLATALLAALPLADDAGTNTIRSHHY